MTKERRADLAVFGVVSALLSIATVLPVCGIAYSQVTSASIEPQEAIIKVEDVVRAATEQENVWLAFAKEFGVPTACVAFFIWAGWVREKALASRLREVEDRQVNMLSVIASSAVEAEIQVKVALCAMLDELALHPCLADEPTEERLKQIRLRLAAARPNNQSA
jgi:hypothetical protein